MRPLSSFRQPCARSFERLDRRLLVNAQNNRIFWRRHVQASHIGSLCPKIRVITLAPARASAEIDFLLAQRTPNILHAGIAGFLGNQRPVPTGKTFRRGLAEHGADALAGRITVFRRSTGTRQIIKAFEPFTNKAMPPYADRTGRGIEFPHYLARASAPGSLQHDTYPEQMALLSGCGAQPGLKFRTLSRR